MLTLQSSAIIASRLSRSLSVSTADAHPQKAGTQPVFSSSCFPHRAAQRPIFTTRAPSIYYGWPIVRALTDFRLCPLVFHYQTLIRNAGGVFMNSVRTFNPLREKGSKFPNGDSRPVYIIEHMDGAFPSNRN